MRDSIVYGVSRTAVAAAVCVVSCEKVGWADLALERDR